MVSDTKIGQVRELVLKIDENLKELWGVVDDAEFHDAQAASQEAADFAVSYHIKNKRWPRWDECFEAGRALGRAEGVTGE